MALRNGLLGLVGAVAVTGSMRAEPPVNPLVEGREPNPVVPEFHEPEPATFGYGGGSTDTDQSEIDEADAPDWWVLLLDHFTMPLGTVEMNSWQ